MTEVWRGRTYHLESGPSADPDRRHLFIVLTEPDDEGLVLVVSLTSTIDTDQTCIIEVGDHRFVSKTSYIAYYRLEKIKIRFLVSQDSNRDDDMKEFVLERICIGLEKSDFVEPRYLQFYRDATQI